MGPDAATGVLIMCQWKLAGTKRAADVFNEQQQASDRKTPAGGSESCNVNGTDMSPEQDYSTMSGKTGEAEGCDGCLADIAVKLGALMK